MGLAAEPGWTPIPPKACDMLGPSGDTDGAPESPSVGRGLQEGVQML